jgi:hypothetical protein
MSVKFVLSEAVLNITGTDADDKVELHEMRSNPASPVADLLQFSWKDNQGKSGKWGCKAAALSKIVFQGNGGDDVLRNVSNPTGSPTFAAPGVRKVISMLPSIEAHGGAGDDTLYGGPKGDFLYGDEGDDKLYGGAGDDNLYGGANNDTLRGDAGDDKLYGGAGDDFYDFGNSYLGGGSLGFDRIYESSTDPSTARSADWLRFGGIEGCMSRAVDVNLGIIVKQRVNDFLTLQLSDAAGIENVEGTGYDDVIRGNARDNCLYGNNGNDRLYGMAGTDKLYGGIGNDALFGGPGADKLYGGPGNDSLLVNDDQDVDIAFGQTGDDRFLVRVGTGGANDTTDWTTKDAHIFFEDGVLATVPFSNFATPGVYAAGQWTTQDIEWVDAAFSEVVWRTNNNKLVKTANGGEMTFVRQGNTLAGPAGIAGWNDPNAPNGRISINQHGINLGRTLIMDTVFHEIGHNWDREYNAAGWWALSGWTNADPENSAYSKGTNQNVNWWYLSSAAFSSADSYYSQSDPDEDFAESFTAYFLERAGLPSVANQIPKKIVFIDNMCTSMTTP